MYFQFTVDRFYDFGINEPTDLPLALDFTNGSLISMPIAEPVQFTTNASAGERLPDFWDSSIPAMSKRFVELLEGAGVTNLQKFSATVTSTEVQSVWKDYYAVNILGLIACVDFNKSEYTEIFPGSFSFDKLAIDATKTNGLLLFRLQEDPAIILIHKSIGKYIAQMDPEDTLVGWDAVEVIQ